MAFRGIATALLGKETDPYFHCNVYEMDENSKPQICQQRLAQLKKEPWKQKYLTCELQTKRIEDLCFVGSVAADDLKGTAKRFFDTVAEVLKLQKADLIAQKYQLPLVLGKDARRGYDVHELDYYHDKFLGHAPDTLARDINDLVFSFGEFYTKTARSREDKPLVETTSIHVFSKQDLALIQTYGAIVSDISVDDETKNWAVESLSELAYKIGSSFAEKSIGITNPHREPRYMSSNYPGKKEIHPDYEFLSWHPDIERAFLDGFKDYRQKHFFDNHPRSIVQSHLYFKHKNDEPGTPFQPFADVTKTMLLDQIAHSEDGIERISTRRDSAFKKLMSKKLFA